jgi:hypothetical protein
MKLFNSIPTPNEATRFGLNRLLLEKKRFQLTIDLFWGCRKKSFKAKKKTITHGLIAWIKVLLTGLLPRSRVFRPS